MRVDLFVAERDQREHSFVGLLLLWRDAQKRFAAYGG